MTTSGRVSPVLAFGGSLAVVFAPLAYRTGWVALGPAFLLLAIGVLVVVGTLLASLVTLAFRRRTSAQGRLTQAAFLAAMVVSIVPLWSIITALGAPPIHDISTDTRNPPQFVAVVPLHTPVRTVYQGEVIASQQRAAYPDLKPVTLEMSPAAAFVRALATVKEMGWELVAVDIDEGRIEATDTTFWFGFKDDVVIRVTPTGGTSRIDIRSLSRVGGGDAGTNAKRIRDYAAALSAE